MPAWRNAYATPQPGQVYNRPGSCPAPAITVASGEELIVETWDAYKGVWGADQEPPEVGAATGPIAVEGAGPGNACALTF